MSIQPKVQGSLVQGAIPGFGLQMLADVSVTSGAPTQVAPGTALSVQGVTVQAPKANTIAVYVGGSDVSATKGFELQPGQSMTLPVQDTTTLWVFAASGGQVVKVGWV